MDKLNESSDCPNLFSACIITRAMVKRRMFDETENVLADTFLASVNSSQPEPSTACTEVEPYA